jgi:hypothetical protein
VDNVTMTRWQVFALELVALVLAFYGLLWGHVSDGSQAVCIAVIGAVVTQVASSHATALGSVVRTVLGLGSTASSPAPQEAPKGGQ